MMLQQQQVMAMMQAPSQGIGFAPAIGQSQYPPAFNYGMQPGPTMQSRGLGAMGGAISAAPTLASGVIGGAGLMSMFGVGGAGTAALGNMDPLGAAWSAGGRVMGGGAMTGGRMMAAGAAGLGVGALAMGAWEGAKFGTGQVVEGMRQQQALQGMLGGAQFLNPMAATGRGFGAGDVSQVGQAIRGMRDPFTSTRDLMQVMQQFTDMGMSQGIRDAEEFSNRFKRMAETVRAMAKTMGTSMQDATRVFGEMRQAGFYTPQDILGTTQQMRMAGGLGIGQEGFLQMQRQGADVSRQMQMSGRAGATLARNLGIGLGMTVQRGALSGERLMDITGAGTQEEAILAMSQQMTGAVGGFLTQKPAGTALLAALGTRGEGGRYTGGIDEEQMQRVRGGQVGFEDLSRMASTRMGGPNRRAGQASFVARQRDIAQNLMQQEGILEGVVAMAETTAQRRYGPEASEDMVQIIIEQQLGVDRRTANTIKTFVDESTRNRAQTARQLRQSVASDIQREEIVRNRTVRGLMTQLQQGAAQAVGGPFQRAGQEMAATFQTRMQRMEDTFFGVSRFNLPEEEYQQLSMDFARGRLAPGITSPRGATAVSGIGRAFTPGMEEAAVGLGGMMARGATFGLGAGLGGAPGAALAGMQERFTRGAFGQIRGMTAVSPREEMIQRTLATGRAVSGEDLGISTARQTELREIGRRTMAGPGRRGLQEALAAQMTGTDIAGAIGRGDIGGAFQGLQTLGARETGQTRIEALPAMMGVTREEAAFALSTTGVQGQAIAARLLRKDITTFGGVLSQEEAKKQYQKALEQAGFDSDEAASMAQGGAGTRLLARLARRAEEEGVDPAKEFQALENEFNGEAEIRGLEGERGEDYVAGKMAAHYSTLLGVTISAEEVKAARKVLGVMKGSRVRKGFAGRADKTKAELVLYGAAAMQGTAGAAELSRSLTETLGSFDMSRTQALAGTELAALRGAASSGQAYSLEGSQATRDLVLALSGQGDKAIKELRQGSVPEQKLANTLQAMKEAKGKTRGEIFERFGVTEAQQGQFKGLEGEALIRELGIAEATTSVLMPGAGGTQLTGNPAVDTLNLTNKLAVQLGQNAEMIAALHTALVTGEPVHLKGPMDTTGPATPSGGATGEGTTGGGVGSGRRGGV